jgi:phosphotransferase system HPr (HPr) family protein
MVSKKIKIVAPNGMHARPVSALVALVKTSGQQVMLRTPQKSVSGSSMIGILSLGLKQGAEVEVEVMGDHEQEVLDQIVTLIESIKE